MADILRKRCTVFFNTISAVTLLRSILAAIVSRVAESESQEVGGFCVELESDC